MRGAVTRPKNITGTGIRPKNITGTGIRPNKTEICLFSPYPRVTWLFQV
jgi:hypothetical protein